MMEQKNKGSGMTCYCSFCGKSQHEAICLIAGPNSVFICDECTGFCADISAEQKLINTVKKYLDAKAIEAGTAETGTGSVHESAVRQDLPKEAQS